MRNGARRNIAAIAAAAALGTGAAVWAASAAAAAAPAIPPVCTSGDLAVWVNSAEGGAALGTVYYPLEFTNISSHTCRSYGYPGVSATNASGKQLGDAAERDSVFKPEWVSIPAGGTAHALFGWEDAAVYTEPGCKAATASLLSVYPPNQASARVTFFSLPVCTAKNHTDLLVSVLQPGVNR